MRAIFPIAATLLLAGLPGAYAADKTPQCFTQQEMTNWKAADRKTIYISTKSRTYYRLDLSHECRAITEPDAQIVMRTFGTDLICSATDFRLWAQRAGPGGIGQLCTMQKLTELSPEEVAALPKKSRP